jgi:hypothetical protein
VVFLVDYLIATGNDINAAKRIMESYSPSQVPVLSQLPATPINDLQLSMIAAVESVRQQRELQPQEIEHLRQRVPTVAQMTQYFTDVGMTNP